MASLAKVLAHFLQGRFVVTRWENRQPPCACGPNVLQFPQTRNLDMSKTATVRARLEPGLKDHAESVFHRLGLNPTQAITIFYRQVELRDGLPFDVAIPNRTGFSSTKSKSHG